MELVCYLVKLLMLLFTILLLCNSSIASDILGCGGFIKSHAPIDFARIEVKLFTKQGSLKDSTHCAPNNGYYFLPLYDKGEYILKINPPTGWSFKPQQVNLKIDGSTDLCSQGKDINFVFEGFGITGQVDNFGGGSGPAGVTIHLIENTKVTETTTAEGGNFYFTPVYPGTYTVVASHPKWKFKKDRIVVQVATGNTDLPKNSLLVSGYDVTGSVIIDRQPIANINFVLFNEESQPALFENCNTKDLLNFASSKHKLCHVTSNTDGSFSFASLSKGKYRIVPFFEDKNVKYHIHPKELEFEVNNDSVALTPIFAVKSFSITGRVLTNKDGKSVHGATIFTNDKPTTVTQADGSFLLENINAGTYNVLIEASGLKFETETLKVGVNIPIMSEFYPSTFQVCGNVANENSQLVRLISLQPVSRSHESEFEVQTTKGSGDFCYYLPPGKYEARVIVPNHDKDKGVQFFPVSQVVEVSSYPVMGINFSQLKATVSGQVQCLRQVDCSQITVILRHVSHDSKALGNKYVTKVDDESNYQVADVIPGTYHVSLDFNKFCWQNNKHTVAVNSKNTLVPAFVQTGYTVIFLSSHNAEVQYQPLSTKPNEKKEVTSLQIVPGHNSHCVNTAGIYEFTLHSCHLFENSIIKYNTDDENTEFVLSPVKHLVTVDIQSNIALDNINVSVSIGEKTSQIGPLKYQFTEGSYFYRVKVHLAENEEATLIPHSDLLWFKPKTFTIIGGIDCVDNGPQILGLKGKLIQGQVIPPLADVKVTAKSVGSETLVQYTDVEGRFKFPTLDDSFEYTVTASKDSYFFTGPDVKGNFQAHKLAEIIVEVVDQIDGAPLQGALLSLSGAESYRSNLITNNKGIIRFSSLSPSDYFLRPMMKEYNFEPSSKMISIKEGSTINIKLSGQRVAYSVYGSVSSLSGEPEEKMIVTAIGIEHCAQYSEEATSESNGQFRIRGLHPGCKYEIKIKESVETLQKIEKALPEIVTVKIETEDIHNIKLLVLCQVPNMDIIAHVLSSDPEYFRSLRIKLCRENVPNTPVYNIKLDPTLYRTQGSHNPGVLVHLPSLPIDNKAYFIRLDSTLSQSVHGYTNDIKYFVANSSFKYFELKFNPNSHIQDHDIEQTSWLTLPFILLCILAFYNRDKLSQFFVNVFGKIDFNFLKNVKMLKKNNTAPVDKGVDHDEIDQLVQSINASKRKTKVRKI